MEIVVDNPVEFEYLEFAIVSVDHPAIPVIDFELRNYVLVIIQCFIIDKLCAVNELKLFVQFPIISFQSHGIGTIETS